jgi:hypothetical protein
VKVTFDTPTGPIEVEAETPKAALQEALAEYYHLHRHENPRYVPIMEETNGA